MSQRENEPPPGPAPESTPQQPKGVDDRCVTVRLEGNVQLFVSDMPEASFVDLTDTGTHPVFASCWVDGERGKTTYVTFTPCGGVGVFRMDMEFRDGDPDKVKVQLYMRMQDPQTGNRRTVPLSTSCACMRTMLSGGVDEFRMPDQFIQTNFVNMRMRVLNWQDFTAKPLALKPSALNRLAEFNKHVRRVSEAIESNNVLNKTQFLKGADTMRCGDSRCMLPPSPLLFLALALGTPAYSLLLWQP